MTVCSLHPGVVSTELIRYNEQTSWAMRFINGWSWAYFRLFGLSSADGAKTSVYCATDADVPNHNGAYYEYEMNVLFIRLLI